ncbi:MAG TPA: TerC family protein [Planctomycetota bacterium]|jgi:tellurite resistance protein TerC|nr:TerC family protein [Planctomycetota bacterium]
MEHPILWIVFGIVVLATMTIDLGLLHRTAREITTKEALAWTAVWVALGLGFCGVLARFDDPGRAAEYLACYVTEYALSVDNIFVFLVIFTFFAVPPASRHRVLFWGILGAVGMRALFLFGGVALVQRFHWMVWLMGGILVLTGIKLLFQGDTHTDPSKNPVLRVTRKLVPVTETYEGSHFFVRRSGKLFATPLFLTLLVVESTDVLFAVDSVPAALALSNDRLVLLTSNVFAILGLRSLFFAVSGVMKYLRFLRFGLAAILIFVGVKMCLPEEYKIPTGVALTVVGGILVFSVLASIVVPQKK